MKIETTFRPMPASMMDDFWERLDNDFDEDSAISIIAINQDDDGLADNLFRLTEEFA